MKEKLHYAIEAVLAVAVIILFVFQFSDNKKSSGSKSIASEGKGISGEYMPIAYIEIDSLMSSYTYATDLNEQMVKRVENSRANFTEKMRRFDSEVAEFQRKAQTNAFLSQERAEAEQQRLLKKQEELQNLEAQLSQEISEENFRMSTDIRNTIITQLREYNNGKNYQIVLGKMNDNILYADDAYNITTEVVEFLNKQYAASPVAKPSE